MAKLWPNKNDVDAQIKIKACVPFFGHNLAKYEHLSETNFISIVLVNYVYFL